MQRIEDTASKSKSLSPREEDRTNDDRTFFSAETDITTISEQEPEFILKKQKQREKMERCMLIYSGIFTGLILLGAISSIIIPTIFFNERLNAMMERAKPYLKSCDDLDCGKPWQGQCEMASAPVLGVFPAFSSARCTCLPGWTYDEKKKGSHITSIHGTIVKMDCSKKDRSKWWIRKTTEFCRPLQLDDICRYEILEPYQDWTDFQSVGDCLFRGFCETKQCYPNDWPSFPNGSSLKNIKQKDFEKNRPLRCESRCSCPHDEYDYKVMYDQGRPMTITGPKCDIFTCDHGADKKICFNGGICAPKGTKGQGYCRCSDGYTSNNCEDIYCGSYPLKFCSKFSVCDTVNDRCICDEMHGGDACNIKCHIAYNLDMGKNADENWSKRVCFGLTRPDKNPISNNIDAWCSRDMGVHERNSEAEQFDCVELSTSKDPSNRRVYELFCKKDGELARKRVGYEGLLRLVADIVGSERKHIDNMEVTDFLRIGWSKSEDILFEGRLYQCRADNFPPTVYTEFDFPNRISAKLVPIKDDPHKQQLCFIYCDMENNQLITQDLCDPRTVQEEAVCYGQGFLKREPKCGCPKGSTCFIDPKFNWHIKCVPRKPRKTIDDEYQKKNKDCKTCPTLVFQESDYKAYIVDKDNARLMGTLMDIEREVCDGEPSIKESEYDQDNKYVKPGKVSAQVHAWEVWTVDSLEELGTVEKWLASWANNSTTQQMPTPKPDDPKWMTWPQGVADKIKKGELFALIRNSIPKTVEIKTKSGKSEYIWDEWLSRRRDRSPKPHSYKGKDCLFLYPGATEATVDGVKTPLTKCKFGFTPIVNKWKDAKGNFGSNGLPCGRPCEYDYVSFYLQKLVMAGFKTGTEPCRIQGQKKKKDLLIICERNRTTTNCF